MNTVDISREAIIINKWYTRLNYLSLMYYNTIVIIIVYRLILTHNIIQKKNKCPVSWIKVDLSLFISLQYLENQSS